MSQNVAFLEQQGLIKRERAPGGRPLRGRRRVPAPGERAAPAGHGAVAAEPGRGPALGRERPTGTGPHVYTSQVTGRLLTP
ncbi:hypothetical protein LCN96_30415 [Nonomuraea gerenzanensis]|nr:hypothetical protein LCN96_30415 [Nonomuraea gerenzanensis]